MRKVLAIIFFLFSINANACLNIFAVDSIGRIHYLEHSFFFSIEFSQQQIAKNLKVLERKFKHNDYSYKNISDYGAYLLMAGRFTEGLDLFRTLSKKYQSVYEINANTAVAYELNGNIDSALFWERAAIKLDPAAHNNSEWIHLKILEAKKKVETDKDWCLKNNITGIVDSIKNNYKFQIHEDGDGWIFKLFLNQLEERFSFTYAEDKVMGKLLLELGDAYQVASIYRSYYCYAIAKYLYPKLSSQLDEKMRLIKIAYPINTAKVDGRTITLSPGSHANKEMMPPDDREVKQFINKLINRPAIKNNGIKLINIKELINKI